MRIAIYPGSFDPVTLGHLDIIHRTKKFADKIIVAILQNSSKQYSFSVEERIEFLNNILSDEPNIEIETFKGLLVDFVKAKKAHFIVRGIRFFADFEYELQMTLINNKLDSSLETIFLMPRNDYSALSSSVVKEICIMGGSIENLVPEILVKRITKRLLSV